MDPTERAFHNYFRDGGAAQPQGGECIEEHDGKQYVVLRNVRGILAVYCVQPSGSLRSVYPWPAALPD